MEQQERTSFKVQRSLRLYFSSVFSFLVTGGGRRRNVWNYREVLISRSGRRSRHDDGQKVLFRQRLEE